MTTNKETERDQALAREAWTRMEARLQSEPANPAWATWNERRTAAQSEQAAAAAETVTVSGTSARNESAESAAAAVSSPAAAPAARRRLSAKARKNIVRLAVTAAAAAAIVTAVTPAGNRALADMLNRFTMQDVVLVQENDMRNMIQSVYNYGESYESNNRYGSSESISLGKFEEDETPETFRTKLGFKPIVAPDGGESTMSMWKGSKTVMKLNVAEVNETMRRLGAPHLFPQEADGKAITLISPAAIYYNFNPGDDTGNNWAVLTQSNMPTVEFDDTFPVEETMKAVINFPALPGELKNSLEHSAVSSGKLPLPMYANGAAHQIDVNGVKATYMYDAEGKRYTAFWSKDNQLFEFNASESFRQNEAGFLEFLKGLVAQ
ncbi:hypothetical protein [Saccharibacillus alkalitolerans]|uniref:DUF4367 domain-containing protein n=1 Tax=Saccharibacillus alkalitolerans TaxID=2705290 RepID=A0ABX0FDH0_9BACL|nr:hypothetical protein [Saccharibacillus alkalitolerans]NGZ77759.1 hypothetical protein [Saccharibacillus alkalitolerans]